MKYSITVDQQTFEVEVTDLEANPILVLVDGEPIEVHIARTDIGPLPEMAFMPLPPPPSSPSPLSVPAPAARPATDREHKVVYAPMPGVITELLVKVGESVEVGQALCILEAMKMKNNIRAVKAGRIAEINVAVGQQVAHRDVLMTYAE